MRPFLQATVLASVVLCAWTAHACLSNSDCPRAHVCVKKIGDCDGSGTCQLPPDLTVTMCHTEPVCGCDGKNYSNACEALHNFVSIAHKGFCRSPCRHNAECPTSSHVCVKKDGDCDGLGKCELRPDSCLEIFKPVCGCDGKTYGNECEAKANSVNVAHEGSCPRKCRQNSDCPTLSHICKKKDGDCNGLGKCQLAPDMTLIRCMSDPVCGCDGKNYSNSCEANANYVNVAHKGFCTAVCRRRSDCPRGHVCVKQIGDCDGLGTCELPPDLKVTMCHTEPVCGCDGKNYSNGCEALLNFVSIAHKGVCPSPCRHNAECPPSHVCVKDVGDCEGLGKCELRPDSCRPKFYDPVCGCDGKNYTNSCLAKRNYVNVAHKEFCPSPCRQNWDCPTRSHVCVKAVGDCDGLGKCELRPDSCLEIVKPVCGCDGKNYSNACQAKANYVNVAHEGWCVTPCRGNAECPQSHLCVKHIGNCYGIGKCELRPDFCEQIHDPVCGCDGRTYSNDCFPKMHNMNIAYKGSCIRV